MHAAGAYVAASSADPGHSEKILHWLSASAAQAPPASSTTDTLGSASSLALKHRSGLWITGAAVRRISRVPYVAGGEETRLANRVRARIVRRGGGEHETAGADHASRMRRARAVHCSPEQNL